jgi:hypothetical protein
MMARCARAGRSGTGGSCGPILNGSSLCGGADTEFNSVAEEFFEKVVPRLLRPLQSGGRSIKPTLVHGDL